MATSKADELELTGERIRAARQALGLSATALGAELGLYRDTIGRWERGQQSPESPALLAFALVGLAARDVASAWAGDGTPHEALARLRSVATLTGVL